MKKTYTIIFSLLSVFALFTYTLQVEELIKNNRIADKYTKKVKLLQEEGFSLKQGFETVALSNVENKIKEMGMIENDSLKYVPMTLDTLVKK